jgi:hypothetical protein
LAPSLAERALAKAVRLLFEQGDVEIGNEIAAGQYQSEESASLSPKCRRCSTGWLLNERNLLLLAARFSLGLGIGFRFRLIGGSSVWPAPPYWYQPLS